MKDEFYIILVIKKTNTYLLKILQNYPKVEYVLKNNLEGEIYSLLKNSYKANIMIDKRIDYQKELVVSIKMIDYYLYLSYMKKIISKKQYENSSKYLLNIMKSIYGWINSEKKRQSI